MRLLIGRTATVSQGKRRDSSGKRDATPLFKCVPSSPLSDKGMDSRLNSIPKGYWSSRWGGAPYRVASFDSGANLGKRGGAASGLPIGRGGRTGAESTAKGSFTVSTFDSLVAEYFAWCRRDSSSSLSEIVAQVLETAGRARIFLGVLVGK
jgi:hypothetical protein